MSPQASFRRWIGVCKDSVNANLSAATSVGATTLNLTNMVGSPTSSYSAIIVDGVNTETVAVSAVTQSTGSLSTPGLTYSGSAGNYVVTVTVSSWTGGTPAVGSLLTLAGVGGIVGPNASALTGSFLVTASTTTTATLLVPVANVSGTWTSGGTASTVLTATVGTTAYAHAANTYVYFQLTASLGPSAYISVTKIDASDDYVQLYDKGYRGSNVDIYGAQQGTRVANVSFDGDFFPDTAGYLISSLMGSNTYTAGTPNTVAFSPLNYGNAQPQPYLFYSYEPSNSNTRVYAKAVVSDMTLKFAPGALVQHSTTIKAFASGVVANPTTIPPTFSTFVPLAARFASATIGGTVTGKVESIDYTFKRSLAEIFTLQGVQDPLAIFSGPLAVSAKASLVIDDDVQLLNYINQSQPSFLLTALNPITAGATQVGVTVQTTKANYEAVKIVQSGKQWVTLDVPFQAIANSTDKQTNGGGLSPCLVTLSIAATGSIGLY